jgi:hypothetical protein
MMLNPTQTGRNREITRILGDANDVARPLKAARRKQFAGKIRARIVEKSRVESVQCPRSAAAGIEAATAKVK